jgi:hypothetical protein
VGPAGAKLRKAYAKSAKGDLFGKAIINRDTELNGRSARGSDIPFKPRTILIMSLQTQNDAAG